MHFIAYLTSVDMYESKGKIKEIFDQQTFPSGFNKREFVITTADSKFPEDIKFELVKEKCTLLDSLKKGQDVTVNFDIRGNEYQGKYYVNLRCWRLRASDAISNEQENKKTKIESSASIEHEPSTQDLLTEEDDVPF